MVFPTSNELYSIAASLSANTAALAANTAVIAADLLETAVQEAAGYAGDAATYANSFAGQLLERDGDKFRIVNILDSGIALELDLVLSALRVYSLSLEGSVTSPSYTTASGFQLNDSSIAGVRFGAGGNEYWIEASGGVHRTARTEANEALIRKAMLRSSFTGEHDKLPVAASAQVNLVIWFGQSWSMGFDAVPVVNGQSNFSQVLTFNGGVRQQKTVAEDASALQSFVTGVETQVTGTVEIPSGIVGETGAISFANRVIELLRDENNLTPSDDFRVLVAAPGEGSKSIEALIDPSGDYMARIEDIINQAFTICQANDWTLAVPAVCWLQGQGDSDDAGIPGDQAGEYPQEMENGRLLVQSFVEALIPDHPPVKWITWQQQPISNTITAQGSAKLAYERFVSGIEAFPHIVCSGPAYQYQNISSSNIHIDAWGMSDIGATMAVAFKRAVIDDDGFVTRKPTSLLRQGRIAVLETNLSRGSLVIDTTQVAEATKYGFNLYASDGSALTINTVTVSGNRVQIVAASDIPSGAQLGYADTGTNYSRTTKWRGNIRDDAGKNLSGQNNWLVAFRLPFDN